MYSTIDHTKVYSPKHPKPKPKSSRLNYNTYVKENLISKEIEITYKKFKNDSKIRVPNLSMEKQKERQKNLSI